MHFPIRSAAVFEFSMIGVKVRTGVIVCVFEDRDFEFNDGGFFGLEDDDNCELDCEVCSDELLVEEKMAFEDLLFE